jgi:hypothetical protein
MKKERSLFTRLTKLFRSGPVVKRKIRNPDSKSSSYTSSLEIFKRSHSDVYSSTLSAYGSYDRMSRYSDFAEMEATPEISSALDIYAEECAAADDKGRVLHIYSDNRKIKEILETLFHDTLNIEFNLSMWVRNLCKYGDFFLFNDVHPEYGITNAYPIPISEMEREEGFDKDDPSAVRFRWITQGNQVLENWQVTHMRLLGNDAFLPYGSSVLEGARRIWRQLILIEDAMLVYRVVRSPDRRVFYIDVGNVPPEEVGNYLEQAKTALKRNQIIDRTSGRVDLRYNPMSVDEDYYLPVRGSESGTKIDTLAGGTNAAAIEDVQYIQKKLFSALKIPKAYLGYDEDIGAKATLAQEDIRFSRTISRIQRTIIAELNKIAMIHLYINGYDSEDLVDFEMRLSNPSSIAQQQKLELIKMRFEIASGAPEGLVSKTYIRKNILEMTDEQIEMIRKERIKDTDEEKGVEVGSQAGPAGGAAPEEGGSAPTDMFGGGGGGAGEAGGAEAGGGEAGGATDLFSGAVKSGDLLKTAPKKMSIAAESPEDLFEDDELDEDALVDFDTESDDKPIKASNEAQRGSKGGHGRKGRDNKLTSAVNAKVDIGGMLRRSTKQDKDSYGLSGSAFEALERDPFDQFLEKSEFQQTRMTRDAESLLQKMKNGLRLQKKVILREGNESHERLERLRLIDLIGAGDDE